MQMYKWEYRVCDYGDWGSIFGIVRADSLEMAKQKVLESPKLVNEDNRHFENEPPTEIRLHVEEFNIDDDLSVIGSYIE